eukprot:m.21650 g.21650  ORF g.21650 m.21650 type:complete len:1167 (+) comp5717_c0_seq1:171-3671(+)
MGISVVWRAAWLAAAVCACTAGQSVLLPPFAPLRSPVVALQRSAHREVEVDESRHSLTHLSQTPTSSPSSTPPPHPAGSGCAPAEACLAHPACAVCLRAIGPYGASGTAINGVTGEFERAFFSALEQTPACLPNTTPPDLVYKALVSLASVHPATCPGMPPTNVFLCQGVEFACFANATCRGCLAALLAPAARPRSVLHSPECQAPSARAALASMLAPCSTRMFPKCSYSKVVCNESRPCRVCWDALQAGDGAAAASRCGSSAVQPLVEAVVHSCLDSAVGCDYFRTWCSADPSCGGCRAAMKGGASASDVVAGWVSAECAETRRTGVGSQQRRVLERTFLDCPYSTTNSECGAATAKCILGDPVCGGCLNASAHGEHLGPECTAAVELFQLAASCAPCPDTVRHINIVVMVTSGVGATSAVLCLWVLLTIVGQAGKHAGDAGAGVLPTRDRVIVGLMLANAVYSSSNAVPMLLLRDSALKCGELALSYRSVSVGRAVWFGGKYALVGFELFILAASAWVLRHGAGALPWRVEAAGHLLCFCFGLVAFAVFLSRATYLNNAGLNEETEQEAKFGLYNHASAADDADDDFPSGAAAQSLASAHSSYDSLVQEALQVWNGFLGLAVLMWIGLRLTYRDAQRSWRDHAQTLADAEEVDPWASTRRGAWEAERRLASLQQRALDEVARPLEPFVLIFLLFGTPAVVMSTDYCQERSGVSAAEADILAPGIRHGTCDVYCEFALSFRSAATVLVFLLHGGRWKELSDVRGTFYGLVQACRSASPTPQYRQPSVINRRSTALLITPPDLEWRFAATDVEMTRKLASGAFGAVWEGWSPRVAEEKVAIKVMFAGDVDEEGDLIDPQAEELFNKECRILIKLKHPNLLRFFGYGTTEDGYGFIVTEFMALGSLRAILDDATAHPLPWGTRYSIALQISLGMEHLHGIPLIHRDLKPDNVLADEGYRVKVADFGSSARLRSPRPEILYSAFTGATAAAPSTPSAPWLSKLEVPKLRHGSNHSASSSATHDQLVLPETGEGRPQVEMTKAVGTLLWMAPEMFRGDENYGPAVDVYSFGLILWELMHRKKPWEGELASSLSEADFFHQLNMALQTGRRPAFSSDVRAQRADLVAVAEQCWGGDPIDRPKFAEVTPRIASCLRIETRGSTDSKSAANG